MMKILLLSDTHGNLDLMNELALKTKANFIIHAGDFGFYDEKSVFRISQRELRLLISHSPHWKQYPVDKHTDRKVLIEIINIHHLLGDFPDYISRDKKFVVPVYAVWGNHEDLAVLKDIRQGLQIENLHMLDEKHVYEFQDNSLNFALYGLGGNFLVSKKLFDKPIAGNSGKVWSTLHQFGELYKNIKDREQPSIFVSHVSPGKEPLLTRLISTFTSNFWISGHMGAPYTCVWNQFTIREMNEALEWFQVNMDLIDKQCQSDLLSEETRLACELIKRDIPKNDSWFKKMWNINLPDVQDGYAVLNIEDGRFSLETFSEGVKFKVG